MLATAFVLLGAAGAFSALASEMMVALAGPLALAALGYGMWLGHRELRQPVAMLVVPTGEAPVTLQGQPLEHFEVEWRWPLAILRARTGDGRPWRVVLAPDRLHSATRRELRLAMQARHPGGGRRSMAP